MEVLEIGEKQYIKTREAAKKTGYTADYIGQLCRSGSIDAHLVGRSWYVNIDDLASHRGEAKRNARVKARKQVREAIAAEREASATRITRTPHVSYSVDERELMPDVRKMTPEAPAEAVADDTYDDDVANIPITVTVDETVVMRDDMEQDADPEEAVLEAAPEVPAVEEEMEESVEEPVVVIEEAIAVVETTEPTQGARYTPPRTVIVAGVVGVSLCAALALVAAESVLEFAEGQLTTTYTYSADPQEVLKYIEK